MLSNNEIILLNSKGYTVADSNINGVVQYNLIECITGLVVAHTPKLSLMVKYLRTNNYI